MKINLLIILMLLPVIANAFTGKAKIEGLWYEIVTKDKEAKVVAPENGDSYVGAIVIPETIDYEDITCRVTEIGNSAFLNQINVTSLTIPNSVSGIGYNAFFGCKGLTSIILSDNLSYIGSASFAGCTSLTSIIIPDNLATISLDAFSGCSKLKEVYIGKKVSKIEQRAFEGCTELTSVHITDLSAWCRIECNDGNINSNPLYYARHLYLNKQEITNLIIPNDVDEIKANIFRNCEGLKNVVIPNNVTIIKDEAFRDCINIETISLAYGLKSIYWAAFYNCSSLKSIVIPNSVTGIGPFVFQDCHNLLSAELSNSISEINGDTFRNCSSLKTIVIPNSVQEIGYRAFQGCKSLTDITIGSGIKNIGSGSNGHVGDGGSFEDCPEITDFYCYAENVPSTYFQTFDNSYIDHATLHVPESAIEKYKSKRPWNGFKNIVATNGETENKKCATPTILYKNGILSFNCKTEGAICHSSITDSDVSSFNTNEIKLEVTYHISVYATKTGYNNSDIATATLCWIDVEPKTEGIENNVALVRANAVLIQTENGHINITGLNDGTIISVFDINGIQVGLTTSRNGQANIPINLQYGSIAIIKIGDKSMKVAIK